jgi:4-hydroxybenzoate polyprenyltransferase
VQWVLSEELAGRAPTKVMIRSLAELTIQEAGQTKPLKINWVDCSTSQHEEIQIKYTTLLEASRMRSATTDALGTYALRLNYTTNTLHVDSDRTYNADENGVANGETNADKVIGTSLTSHSEVIGSDPRQWLSNLECGSATGATIRPSVVFTGKQVNGQWSPEGFPNWTYGCAPSGRSSYEIFLRWFKSCFLPDAKPKETSLWRILILDGHKSHLTASIIQGSLEE